MDYSNLTLDQHREYVRRIVLERDQWQRAAEKGDKAAARESRRHSAKLSDAITQLKLRCGEFAIPGNR